MTRQAEYRYVFRGSALAAGGRIRRPDVQFLSAAPALVGVSGGHSRSEQKEFRAGDVVSIASAESDVTADYQDPEAAVKFTFGNYTENRLPTRSVVQTTVRGLRIVNADDKTKRTLACDTAFVKMMSEWPGSQKQPSFKSIEASITQLTLDDYVLEVYFRPKPFNDRDTRAKLKQIYSTSESWRKQYGGMIFTPAGTKPDRSTRPALPEAAGLTYCTIVERLAWKDGRENPNARIVSPNKVVFDGFGSVYFGELFISDFSRRLTLIRAELGSPCGGSFDCAEVETDGHGYPPD